MRLDDNHAYVKLYWNGIWCGIDEWHRKADGEWCVGYCLFAVPEADAYADCYAGGQRGARWQTLKSGSPDHDAVDRL